MLGDVVHNLFLLAVSKFYLYKGTVHADALCAAGCHYALVVHVVQSVLNRR